MGACSFPIHPARGVIFNRYLLRSSDRWPVINLPRHMDVQAIERLQALCSRLHDRRNLRFLHEFAARLDPQRRAERESEIGG